ncbi:unnamed protein product [Strongylus vulgaris]|uniref:DAN domain-containing protein n=1 Tax=Strongylus vulgaris TaxID=40348 RepID=A0A3P7I6Y0_STRVU|nr:unnamed protein product [Strongylus vulgaris]
MNGKMLKAKFKSCAACAPRDYDAVDVTLDCPGQDPPQVTKTIIKQAEVLAAGAAAGHAEKSNNVEALNLTARLYACDRTAKRTSSMLFSASLS